MAGKDKVYSTKYYIQNFDAFKLFGKTKFTDKAGHMRSLYGPLTIGGFKGSTLKNPKHSNARLMSLPAGYNAGNSQNIKGQMRTRTKWAAFGPITKLTPIEWRRQLIIAAHQSEIAKEQWKTILIKRAETVFKESFTLKRFNSKGSEAWPKNTQWTIKKRRRTEHWEKHKRWGSYYRTAGGTWPGAGGLMQETGRLSKQFKIIRKPFSLALATDTPYAGIHNAPEGSGYTYGRICGAQPVKRRQFMGHSTLIDDFIEKYERRYLFDDVFRTIAR